MSGDDLKVVRFRIKKYFSYKREENSTSRIEKPAL
jgi:hypothetical protein